MRKNCLYAALLIATALLLWCLPAAAAPEAQRLPRVEAAQETADGSAFTVWIREAGACELMVTAPGGASRTYSLPAAAGGHTLQVQTADFDYAFGTYGAAAFSMDPDGSRTLLGVVHTSLQPRTAGSYLQIQPAERTSSGFMAELAKAEVPQDCPVFLRFWPTRTGGTMRSCPAVRHGDTWNALLPAAGLESGTYKVAAYAGNCASPAHLCSARFVVPGVNGELRLSQDSGDPGAFHISLRLPASPAVKAVRAAVWSEDDQSDLVWYDMEKSAAAWQASGNIDAHGRHMGTYQVHAWAELASGVRSLAGTGSLEVGWENDVWIEQNPRQRVVYIQRPQALPVRAAVWSAADGQDDLVWYDAEQISAERWRVIVPLARHAGSGVFHVHVYTGTTCVPAAFEATADQMQSSQTLRGLWVASVWNMDFPTVHGASAQQEEFRSIVRNARDWGFNALFVQVRPQADALYASDINPWSHVLTGVFDQNPGYDPLAFMLETAHAAGLELHAWLNPYRVCSESQLSKLAVRSVGRQHPDWLLHFDGTVYLDPARPEVREHVTSTVEEILRRYDIDGIHFDDYFYPYNYPLSPGEEPDGAQGNARREQVTQLVRDVSRTVRAAERPVTFGISPYGVWKNASTDPAGSNTSSAQSYYSNYCDSVAWVQEGLVDYICPQLYWQLDHPTASYRTLLDWWSGITEGTGVDLLIGQGIYKPEVASEISAQLRLNETSPAYAGSIFFRYSDIAGNPALSAALRSWNSRYHA